MEQVASTYHTWWRYGVMPRNVFTSTMNSLLWPISSIWSCVEIKRYSAAFLYAVSFVVVVCAWGFVVTE
jgi:hypothetical protein